MQSLLHTACTDARSDRLWAFLLTPFSFRLFVSQSLVQQDGRLANLAEARVA